MSDEKYTDVFTLVSEMILEDVRVDGDRLVLQYVITGSVMSSKATPTPGKRAKPARIVESFPLEKFSADTITTLLRAKGQKGQLAKTYRVLADNGYKAPDGNTVH